MGVPAGQVLIPAAFRKLAAATKIATVLGTKVRSLDELTRYFESLPWDEKVFSVSDETSMGWAVDVRKAGPTLTLQPTRPDVEGKVVVAGSAFWKHFVSAIEGEHPGFHFEHTENLFERLVHDRGSEGRRKELAVARHEEEAVRAHRLKMRDMQRTTKDQWRETKAEQDRYMYWLWYQ